MLTAAVLQRETLPGVQVTLKLRQVLSMAALGCMEGTWEANTGKNAAGEEVWMRR